MSEKTRRDVYKNVKVDLSRWEAVTSRNVRKLLELCVTNGLLHKTVSHSNLCPITSGRSARCECRPRTYYTLVR